MKKNLKALSMMLVLIVLALGLAACGGEEAAEQEPFTIGISNSFITSEYRTQMIDVLQSVNAEFMDDGITTELVIESENTDVAGQIQQIQNLMNQGVDAIIVNPGDVEGLNLILEEAVEAGIVVIAIDQEIGAEGVYNVAIDQKEWAMTSAEWFADTLGAGDVVLIEGFVGHPANVARMEGVEEVFANYPDINVVGRESGMWDEATGQQVMADFLAAFPELDGYWTQDGMAIGALEAVIAADPPEWPVAVGEGRVKFLKLWKQVLDEYDPDFQTIAVANPPGVAGSGLRIAVELLQGAEIKDGVLAGPWGTTFYMPIPVVVTPDNFDEVYAEYVEEGNYPDSYLLDGILSQEEVKEFFE